MLLSAVVVTATGLAGAVYLQVASRIALQRAEVHVRDLAKTLAHAVADPILREDRPELLRVADALMTDGRLSYVAFANRAGGMLAAAQQQPGELLAMLDRDGSSLVIGPLDRPTVVGDPGRELRVDLTFPVEDRSPDAAALTTRPVGGFVRLGLNVSGDVRILAAARRQVTGIAIGIALLMVPLGYEIVRYIVGPLNQLAAAAGRIAAGHLNARVDLRRGDEIGRVGDAFNHMAAELARAHAAQAALNAQLEQRVSRRTEELACANRLLEIQIAEREELLRAVSHDLNAPLRNVAGLVLLLRRKLSGAVPDSARHCLDRIEHNIQYEMSMIEELLELSRTRNQREERQLVDLDAELRSIAGHLSFELDRKKIPLRIIGRLPPLYVERRRFRRLFQNLLDNAIKYTPPADAPGRADRRRDIRITCAQRPDEFEFRVADCGIGVDPADRQSVFGVFGRARNEYVSRTNGKGVGLAYCKTVVQMYDGRIWIEENRGGGSVFAFTVRRAAVKPPTAPPEAPGRSAGAAAGTLI